MWTITILMGGLMLGQVDVGGTADLKLEVRRLLRQLNADHQSDRDAAVRKLTAMGQPVLDLLPPPNEKVAPAVRQGVERVRQAILREMAKAAVRASDGDPP